MKLPFFWHREDKTFEFQENMALSQQTADANAPQDPYEAAKAAERERLMLGDERTARFLDIHPEFHAFIPALAPVNRTTKHISKRDAMIAWLDFQILFTMEEMCMRPEAYEAGGLEILQGLEIFASTQISDGFEGWKGRILTEQKKIIATEFRKGK